MEAIYSQITEVPGSGKKLGSFIIDGEVEKCDHLANAVLHCCILVSVGLIRTSFQDRDRGDGKTVFQYVRK